MGTRAALVAGLVWLGCGPARSPANPTQFHLPVEPYVLRNGLRVVLQPDPAATMVTLRVRYRVGAIDEPADQGGVAHLAAHLLSVSKLASSSTWAQIARVASVVELEP